MFVLLQRLCMQVTWLPATDMYVCREYWPSRTSRQFFTTSSLVFQYLAPGTIITFCYVKVILQHASLLMNYIALNNVLRFLTVLHALL